MIKINNAAPIKLKRTGRYSKYELPIGIKGKENAMDTRRAAYRLKRNEQIIKVADTNDINENKPDYYTKVFECVFHYIRFLILRKFLLNPGLR